MTRKDYKIIANVFKEEWNSIPYTYNDTTTAKACLLELIVNMADQLETDNPRFLYKRFYEACGVGEELK